MMFKRQSIRSLALFLLFLLFLEVRVSALDVIPSKDKSKEEPVSITSNRMTVRSQEDKIVFEGNVFIKKGTLKIKADRAEIFLAEKKSGEGESKPLKSSASLLKDPASKGEKEVSRIEATGNVDLQQDEKHAKAQKGVYDQKKNEVVLTGEPEAWENDYRVKGKVITFFLNENRSVVEGSEVVIRSKPSDLKLKGK